MKRHADVVCVLEEIHWENTDVIGDVKVDTLKLWVERNPVTVRLEELKPVLQTLANENVDGKVTLNEAMAKIRELLESGRSIDRSNFFVKIAKLAWRCNSYRVSLSQWIRSYKWCPDWLKKPDDTGGALQGKGR